MKPLLMTLALTASLLAAPAAQAGRSCDAKAPTTQSITSGLAMAERTLASLEGDYQRSGTQAVLLARAGQDLSKYGVRYSHLGIAYRTTNVQGEPVWRVLHKLNECGTRVSAIYRQGLGEFFLDDPWRYEAVWLAPAPEVQARLLTLLEDPARATRLHHRPYNMVSYAWGRQYQQSNQWVIETLAAAMAPQITTRDQAQAWLQFKGYEPATLKLGPLTRLGGRVGSANIAFDDHPGDKRFSDRIETVTVDSVLSWLPRTDLGVPGRMPVVVR